MSDPSQRLRELHQQATPGPWWWHTVEPPEAPTGDFLNGDDGVPILGAQHSLYDETHPETFPANAALIAAMRNALPALLDLWEAAQEHAKLFDKLGYPRLGADAGIDNTRARLDDALARLREEPGT